MGRMVIIETFATFRWLMAAYTALWLPVCCCYSSVLNGSETPHPPHDHAAHVHEDHAEGDGNHGRASGNDHHSDRPESGHHDGTCDCGCFGSDYPATTLKTSGGLGQTVQFTSLPIAVVSCAIRPAIPLIHSAEHVPRATTSLFQQRCALIV